MTSGVSGFWLSFPLLAGHLVYAAWCSRRRWLFSHSVGLGSLRNPEAGFGVCQSAVGGDDVGGAGLCGCEVGVQRVAAYEEFLVGEGIFVVAIDEAVNPQGRCYGFLANCDKPSILSVPLPPVAS